MHWNPLCLGWEPGSGAHHSLPGSFCIAVQGENRARPDALWEGVSGTVMRTWFLPPFYLLLGEGNRLHPQSPLFHKQPSTPGSHSHRNKHALWSHYMLQRFLFLCFLHLRIFSLLSERETEREVREKRWLAASHMSPNPGIEPTTLWFWEDVLSNWATGQGTKGFNDHTWKPN